MIRNTILTNPRFDGVNADDAAPEFCDGWTVQHSGSSEQNHCVFSSVGVGRERRINMQLTRVERWFRLVQRVEPVDGAVAVRCSITCGRNGIRSEARLVRVGLIAREATGHLRPHVNIAPQTDLPELPQTIRFEGPMDRMDESLTYSFVLEFNAPVDLDIWNVSLQYLAMDGGELPASPDPDDRETADGAAMTGVSGVPGVHDPAFRRIDNGGFTSRIDAANGRAVAGWAVSQADKARLFEVDVLIDGVLFGSVRNDQLRDDLASKGLSAGRGGFRMELPPSFADGEAHDVQIRMPDGSLSGTGQLRASPVAGGVPIPSSAGSDSPDAITVVVPVYNAFEDLCECVERLRSNSPAETSFVFVDDMSTDDRVVPFLQEFVTTEPRASVLRNVTNRGFSNTVNRGIEAAGSADVVILNSDARVTPGWIDSLRDVARSRPKVATVTPLSDNAGAFSAPDIGRRNEMPVGMDERDIAVAIRRRSARLRPEVPTGNGFCMFISRASIDALGLFDAEAFPRGYGEENDFCMRARRAGWVHLMDDATYVFHERSASFGSAKTELMASGRAIVDERYPEYGKLTSIFRSPSMNLVRYRVRQAIRDAQSVRRVLPRALYVYSTQTGGTPQTNRDLMSQLQDRLETWTLRCNARTLFLEHFEPSGTRLVASHHLENPIDPVDHRSAEYDRVVHAWLRDHDISLVHVRHLGWHGLGLPQAAASLGIPVVLSFHDFYSVCPSVNLIDDKQRYCAGACTAGEGTCGNPLWAANSLPTLKHGWVHRWRELQAAIFPFCSAFITTSNSARDVLEKAFPILDGQIRVIPHGRTMAMTGAAYTPPGTAQPIRILVPGNIGVSKGLDVMHELLRIDGGRALEFHVLGKIAPEDVRPGIVCHGTYGRDDIGARINQIAPTIAAVFSIWDETWCHTLTEMWAAGVPTIVFDYGTLSNRMRECGGGWVFSHEDPAVLRRQIIMAVEDTEGYAERREAVARWQRTTGRALNGANMAARYFDVYRGLVTDSVRPSRIAGATRPAGVEDSRVAVVCPADSCLESAPASTHIRIWSRTRSSLNARYNYFRCTPDQFLAGVRHGEIERAIVQRNALPIRAMQPVLTALDEGRLRLLYDIDDDLLDVPVQKDPLGIYRESAPQLGELIRRANVVTVSTPSLQKKMSGLNTNVELLPNLLDETVWRSLSPERFDRDPDKVVLMYMGSHTHDADLDLILPAFDAACRRVPDLHLRIVGGFAQVPDGLSDRIEIVEVPSSAKSYPDFVRFLEQVSRTVDFALAPLVDTSFNACKSELKVLEYAGLSLSGIYSNVEVYRGLTRELGVGRLVGENVDSWADAIVTAAFEKQKLHEEGLLARERVLDEYTIAGSMGEFESLIESLANAHEPSSEQPKAAPVAEERSALDGC